MKSKTIYVLQILTLIVPQIVHCLHFPQYFQAYNLSYCLGDSYDFMETIPDTTKIPGLQYAKTIRVRGAWRIQVGEETRMYDSSDTDTFCTELPDTGLQGIRSFTKLVPSDLDETVLVIFSEPNFQGESITIAANTSKLEKPIVAKSWLYTGIKYITLYSQENYTGVASRCLRPSPLTMTLRWGIQKYDPLDVNVNSVKISDQCETQ